MTAHITWDYPTTWATSPPTPMDPNTILSGSVYDTASLTPIVPVAQFAQAIPGRQGAADVPVTPGSTHGYYVVISAGSLQSAPTATFMATAPSSPPSPAANLNVTFI